VRRRRALAAVALTAAAVSLGTVGLVIDDRADATADPDRSSAGEVAAVAVVRRTISRSQTFDGELGYRDAGVVTAARPGTLTGVAAVGTVVSQGEVLAAIDEQAMVLLYGSVPAYRALGDEVADGSDVEQLETSLIALGYGGSTLTTADRDWDWRTTAAVRRWQRATDRPVDGRVELGEIAFAPGPLRIEAHSVAVGAILQPGASIAETASTSRAVTFTIDTSDRAELEVGDTVQIALPDGSTTGGTVRSIGRVATAGADGSAAGSGDEPTLEVAVDLTDPSTVSDLDAAPVEVVVTREQHDGVLAVPVEALLALPDGSYAVEVRATRGADGGADGDTRPRRVVVELGLFEDGWVEVTAGDLAEGTQVLVPR